MPLGSKTNPTIKKRKKWHHSPHNRFKTMDPKEVPQQTRRTSRFTNQRSQRQQIINAQALPTFADQFAGASHKPRHQTLLLFIALFLTTAIATKSLPPAIMATTLSENSTTTSLIEPELANQSRPLDEVELTTQARSQHRRRPDGERRQRPHVYRIRAAHPFNGRLGPDSMKIQASDAVSGRQSMKILAHNKAATTTPAGEPQFGTRANQVRRPATATEHEDCKPEEQGNNIAASSPTLRLTAINHNRTQAIVGQPLVEAFQPEPSDLAPVNLKSSSSKIPHHSEHFDLTSTLLQRAGGENQATAASEAESILTLIDDYDSKITTNRTKG